MPYKSKATEKSWGVRYREANKGKISARKKAYYEANKDRVIAKMKAYCTAHKDEKRSYDKVRYEVNKDKVKANRETNKDRLKDYMAVYYKTNKDIFRANHRKRRALKSGAYHEPYKDIDIYERDGWMCGICGTKINRRLKYPHPRSKSIDHIIALINGGDDAPINLQPAHLRCNLKKHASFGGQLRLIG